jgi:acyloxyacyl hydrolase
MKFVFSALIVLLGIISSTFAVEEVNTAYVCSFCLIALGLVEQSAFQIHLENALVAKCNGSELCQKAVKHLILSIEAKAVPEELCAEMSLCTDQCTLFDQWPVNLLPPAPMEWPILRRLSAVEGESKVTPSEGARDLKILKPVFEAMLYPASFLPEGYGPWAHISLALGELHLLMNQAAGVVPDQGLANEPCGFNLTCKLIAVGDHKPFQDHDGDLFSSIYARRLRGTDWRGIDCNDLEGDVYPGRRVTTHNTDIDHNCNGIYGANATASFEDLYCANSQQRGIVILGDSATAHFHIPPAWITAQGWTMDQLLPDAEDELDFPQCSWGTGHMSTTDCPYQHTVPGIDGITSLYTQLRQRNRCNHNDFQNIGVNGARITSSMQLVNAMARNSQDHPLLVWLALIGNDICNGHPTFDTMTTTDEFYTHAMETLTKLDSVVPAGSHVVALALFDGELLYQTMHRHVHPIGAHYQSVYDFMNCLGENPCWGWLNSNETVRRISTLKSNALNRVYQNISDTQTFTNFKFIFYSPNWVALFNDYTATGQPLTDLIEPADGFHPSQTGNALFAKKFFEFLENEHPEAIGPINPFNDEIDERFFNKGKK